MPVRPSLSSTTTTPSFSLAFAALDFSRAEALSAGIQRLRPKPVQAVALIGEALRRSPADATTLTRTLIAPRSAKPTQADHDEADAHADEVVRWAAVGKGDERRVAITAFAQAGRKLELISGMARLQRAQSRPFFKDYFATGGDLSAVVEWLGEAGGALRAAQQREGAKAPVDGWLSDAWESVKKAGKKAAQAIGEAVNTVIDGIASAGRSLLDIFKEAAHWTADRIEDLVETLIDAGRKTVDILVAAVRQGGEAIRGAVNGLLRAGRKLAEVVAWAATQAGNAIITAVDAALDLGRSVAEVLGEAVKLAAAGLRAVVQAVLRAGRKVGQVLAAVASRTASIVKTVIEGVLATGVTLVETVIGVCRDVGEGFRKGFVQGLIAIGKGIGEIFLAAVEGGLGIAALAFAAILEALGGHRSLTTNELREARKVFGNVDWLNRVKVANASYAADFIQAVNGGRPFTTMYVLNFSSKSDFKPNGELKDLETLIHELTHVWQGVQAGPIYMIQALEAQLRARLDDRLPGDDEAYVFTDQELADARGDFSKFTREQQAYIIEAYYRSRFVNAEAAAKWSKYLPYADQVKNARTVLGDLAAVIVKPFIGRAVPVGG